MNPPDQVLAYQEAGWSLVPATIEGKRALTPWRRWQQVAPDPDQLREWAHRWSRCNWAVITGQLSAVVVVDIDPRHHGDHALAELEQRHGDLPWHSVVETPSAGVHVYLRHPGGRIPNSASRIGLGIDIRGDGGLALLRPADGQTASTGGRSVGPAASPRCPPPGPNCSDQPPGLLRVARQQAQEPRRSPSPPAG